MFLGFFAEISNSWLTKRLNTSFEMFIWYPANIIAYWSLVWSAGIGQVHKTVHLNLLVFQSA